MLINGAKTHRVPSSYIPTIKELASAIIALKQERMMLDKHYTTMVDRLNREAEEIREKAIKALCQSLGVEFDPENKAYVVETSYLDHDVSFLIEADIVKDTTDTPSGLPAVPPKGSLLN